MGDAALKKGEHYTYGDYAKFADDKRYELIDGVAYALTSPTWRHQELVGEVFRQLANLLVGKPCRPAIAPLDVRFPKPGSTSDTDDTVLQPDVIIVCDPSRIDSKGVRGAPTFVLEVQSPSTASHDQIRKRRIYEREGVLEYWILPASYDVVTAFRRDTADEPFVTEFIHATGQVPLTPVPDAMVDLEGLFPVQEDV